MRQVGRVLATLLCSALLAYAQGNSFDKVRYNGGTIATKVHPDDWGNKLVVTSELIKFTLKDGNDIAIVPSTVTSLSYGEEAHRRVGTMIALAILIAPVALFGLFHKTKLHFIGVEYTGQGSRKAGLLLQGDKSNYRAILLSLQSVTGLPVAVSSQDRELLPVGVRTSVVNEAEPAKQTQNIQQSPPQSAPSEPTGVASEAPLLGVSGYATETGFRITSVRDASPAASVYLLPGNIIAKVDGKDVHSSRDVEFAIGASTTDTIKILCIIQTNLGTVNSERAVKVR